VQNALANARQVDIQGYNVQHSLEMRAAELAVHKSLKLAELAMTGQELALKGDELALKDEQLSAEIFLKGMAGVADLAGSAPEAVSGYVSALQARYPDEFGAAVDWSKFS
jgi:hypothetical protein